MPSTQADSQRMGRMFTTSRPDASAMAGHGIARRGNIMARRAGRNLVRGARNGMVKTDDWPFEAQNRCRDALGDFGERVWRSVESDDDVHHRVRVVLDDQESDRDR
jgi:hypothetical protein